MLTALDGLEEVELVAVWRGRVCLCVVLKVLHTLVGEDVDLAVVPRVVGGELEGVARVTLHVAP